MQIMSACKKRDIELTILDIFNLLTIRKCAQAFDQLFDQLGNDEGASDSAAVAEVAAVEHSADDMDRIAALLKAN